MVPYLDLERAVRPGQEQRRVNVDFPSWMISRLVVLDMEGIPKTYREKTENFLEVSRLLRDLNKRMAMDLVVMTRTQWDQFIEMNSEFSREVREKGLALI